MKRDLPAYVYRKGRKGLLYFERAGVRVRMHHAPGTAEFAAEYALAMKGRAAAPSRRTFKALIAHYRRSPDFAKLAPRTAKDYDKVLAFIADRLGQHDPAQVRKRHIVAWQAENAGAVRFANYLVQILRILLEHARTLGWVDVNHAKGVKALKSEGPARHPWPDDLVAAYRAQATGPALLIFELCLGTGQRIGDVLRMRWNHIEDGGINVRQGKTGTALWVPITGPLRAVLDQTPKRGLTIVTNPDGRPMAYKTAQGYVRAVRAQIGADAFDIHALRHTKAAELAAAGFTDEQIAAITGHSSARMVAHYTATVRQKARARQIQARRD